MWSSAAAAVVAARAFAMPFKMPMFKSKSKAQYNVASKAVFVITVELLDNAMLECTLTADSTGECLAQVETRKKM